LLGWLADNPLYTKRFAFFVGRRCRETTIREVADELRLDWHAAAGSGAARLGRRHSNWTLFAPPGTRTGMRMR